EGLEPTRSCDHWILSPARLPFRHAGVSKESERIRTSRRSSTRESFRSQTLPTKSSGWRLRGGPKISRKIIAFRKPDVDLSMVATSIFASADLEIGWVAISYSAAAVLITGSGSSRGGISRGNAGGRVFS